MCFPQQEVANEENRPLADVLYELAEFVIHGDELQVRGSSSS